MSTIPTTKITCPEALTQFLTSETCLKYITFLEELNLSVIDKPLSAPCHQSEIVLSIVGILERLSDWVDEIPPLKQPMRYGNKSFRTWFEKLTDNAESLMKEILPESLFVAVPEVAIYFRESWGNQTRIDYGTGHETCFMAWLYCLKELGLIGTEDYHATIAKIFAGYLKVIRKIQKTYGLEPAGSHGVWSLDDYQFLVFYFGSAQLLNHKQIQPSSIRDVRVVKANAEEFMYLDAIQFIHQVKTGPFGEHSPILSQVANVPYWGKVNGGMMKMYRGEVLSKFPIMQHFLLGSFLPFTYTPSPPEAKEEEKKERK